MIVETFTYTKEEFEDALDGSKPAIAEAIAKEFGIDMKEMDEWCQTHTIKLCNKSVFRTITDLWNKEKKNDNKWSVRIVKLV